MEKQPWLVRAGLADSPVDAFANGVMIGALGMLVLWTCTIAMVINFLADKPLVP